MLQKARVKISLPQDFWANLLCGSAGADAPFTVRSPLLRGISDRTFRNGTDRALHRVYEGFFLHRLAQKERAIGNTGLG